MTNEEADTSQPARQALRDALRQEQLRLYRANTLTSQLGMALMAALLVAVMSDSVPRDRLVGWSLAVGLTMALRVSVASADASARTSAARPDAWLWRYRLAVAATGGAWGLAALLLFVPNDLQHQLFLAFVLAGMAAGSLTLTSFDPLSALSFAALALLPLGLRLLESGEAVPVSMAAMAALLMGILGVTALRAWRNVRETVELRIAESTRADVLKRSQTLQQELSAQVQRQSEALEVALGSMAQGILSLGADGRTNFFNRRLVELIDVPESFLAQRPTMDDISRYQLEHGHFGANLELVDDTVRGRLERWIAGEQPPMPEAYFRRTRQGRVLEVKTRFLREGALVRTFSDVTAYFDAQRRLQESQAQSRKLALVAAYTDDAVLILDPERRIEWVNEGFTRLTGYALGEVAGRRPADVLRGPGTSSTDAARLDEQLLTQQRAVAEIVNYAKDGRSYWAAIEMRAIVDDAGAVCQYISIERNISRRKQAEEALVAARDEAERANRAKSEFMSAMSHELRTPMNAILGFAQLLASDPAAQLPQRQAGHVHEILRAGRHLLELIDDVLDLARIEAGQQPVVIGPVGLQGLIEECLLLMHPLARDRAVRLPEAPPSPCEHRVAADRTRLKQVLLNLLSNAIKYNRHGGDVRIACSALGATVQVSVHDTGAGLSPQQCARLFTAFDRLGAEAGPVPGAGIGLVLSKRLVESMHGSIGVSSSPGQGSTFWIELPAAAAIGPDTRPAVPALPPQAAAVDTDRVYTVLYIEDNAVNVLLMEAMLERLPQLRLHCATRPEVGLQMARELRPELILLDIQLPGIDGFEVLRRLRDEPPTRATPVIAISASAMPGDVEQGLAAGFVDYLTKPVEMNRLHAAIHQALRADATETTA